MSLKLIQYLPFVLLVAFILRRAGNTGTTFAYDIISVVFWCINFVFSLIISLIFNNYVKFMYNYNGEVSDDTGLGYFNTYNNFVSYAPTSGSGTFNNLTLKLNGHVKGEDGAKIVTAFWEYDGEITDQFFCSINDVDYADIDNDGIVEIPIYKIQPETEHQLMQVVCKDDKNTGDCDGSCEY